MRRLGKRLRRWWEGEYVPHENDPSSDLVFTGGWYRRHWASRALHTIAEFHQREWKFAVTAYLTMIGIVAAILKLH